MIKVESKDRPEVVRLYVSPRARELGIQPQMSPWFPEWNAGKHFVALDLTKPEAVALALRLAAYSDVLLDNYTSGVLDKLGLSYDAVREVTPEIIYFSTTGHGDSGPTRNYITWGPNVEALAGMALAAGYAHRDCTITQFAYPDALSALHGMVAVMSALDYRRRTGKGQYINLSQVEATISSIGHLIMERSSNGHDPQRVGNRSLQAAPHGCYPCKGEERWIAIAVFGDTEWQQFCTALGEPEWLRDPRFATLKSRLAHQDELDRLIGEWTSTRADYEVMSQLQEAGIAAGVLQNAGDLWEHDHHLKARGFFEEVDHAKKGKAVVYTCPLGLTKTPGHSGLSGQAVGHDNDFVFGELLGIGTEEIEHLKGIGAIQAVGQ